ncbi:MAG: radical SAM protein [Deltaproteobacteria bacterium]|nr:radical SAM protein [Deltaproteobacteria bacterium]
MPRPRSPACSRLAAVLGSLEPGHEVVPGVRVLSVTDGAEVVIAVTVEGAPVPLKIMAARRDDHAPHLAQSANFNLSHGDSYEELHPAARAALATLVACLRGGDTTPLGPAAFAAPSLAAPGRIFDLAAFSSCENRCLFCSNRPRGVRHVPLETIFERLADQRRQGADALGLSAMEPTLDKRLPRIVAEARRLGYRTVTLLTNGLRLDDATRAARLMGAGITRVALALHSARAETEDAICRNAHTLERKHAAIRNVLDLGVPLSVNTVMTRPGLWELTLLCQQLADLGVTRWNVFLPKPTGNCLINFDVVVPPLEALAGPLAEITRRGAAHAIDLSIVDVPACLSGECAPLERRARSVVATGAESPGRRGDIAPGEEKCFGPACDACGLRDRCDGLFAGYAGRLGCEMLRPPAG